MAFGAHWGEGGSLERETRQPVVCRIFQLVRLERGRGTGAACNAFVTGKGVEQRPRPGHTRSAFSGAQKRIATIRLLTRISQRKEGAW